LDTVLVANTGDNALRVTPGGSVQLRGYNRFS
jgi:hypothetical protein